jgi:hypothetical protein
MNEALRRRARDVKARVAVRSWEYRQRHHAKGVWPRLVRALALSAEVHAVDDVEAAALVAEGFPVEPAGERLSPPKRIVIVPPARARALSTARPLPVRLAPELLAARNLVLVPFDDR